MRARDIMTSPVHTVGPDTEVEAAVQRLTAASITAMPVVDHDGALIGMVSEGDLLRHRVPADPTAHLRRDLPQDAAGQPRTVREVMSSGPLTTEPDADVADIAEMMLQHDVRSVPVLDGRRVAGIVSRRDILRAAVRDDEALTREVQHRLDEYAGAPGRWTATVDKGTATVAGPFTDENDRTVVTVLTRSVPGVTAVELTHAEPD